MYTCITVCWIRQLSSTTLNGPVTFDGRELCVFITFSRTKQIFNTTLIGPVVFGGREFCVLVLRSAGSESYLTLL